MKYNYETDKRDWDWLYPYDSEKIEEFNHSVEMGERFFVKSGLVEDSDGDKQLIFYVRDKKTNCAVNFSFNAGWSNGRLDGFTRIILSKIVSTMIGQHNAIRNHTVNNINALKSVIGI